MGCFGIITFTAKDLAQPARQLSKAMYLAPGIATAIYVAIALGTFGTLTVDTVISSGGTALAVAAQPTLGNAGYWLMSVTAVFATAGATNAGEAQRRVRCVVELELPARRGSGERGRVGHHPLEPPLRPPQRSRHAARWTTGKKTGSTARVNGWSSSITSRGSTVIPHRTPLSRALTGVAALLTIGATMLVAAPTAGATPAANAASGSKNTAVPMHIVRVTGLVTTVPDAVGKLRVRLANGAIIAIPASEKDRVMARAAQEANATPNGVVNGDCGSSNVYVQEKSDDHPVRMTTGFSVDLPAIAYTWQVTISSTNYNYVYQQSGFLAFRTSWAGSYDSTDDNIEATYSAAVSPDQSFVELFTGDICFSGGPTDSQFLTSPDAPEANALPLASNAPTGNGGNATPFTVFPPDTRTRVADTTVYPYRAVTRMLSVFSNGQVARCTGFLYASNVLVTAGHCVFDTAFGWAQNIQVTPGRDVDSSGAPVAPYGSCHGTNEFTSEGWEFNADERYDYGAVKLDCTVGDQTGIFALSWPSGSVAGTVASLTGYPSDELPDGTMWSADGPIISDSRRQAFHQISTSDGSSGSPLYDPGCTQTCTAFAIQARGAGGPHPNANAATRITQANSVDFLEWES